MAEIKYTKGDATTPAGAEGQNKIIVHVCNDIGGWGKGFVMAISKRWDGPELRYRRWAEEGRGKDFRLGGVQFVRVEQDLWVANLIGQHKIYYNKKNGEAPPIRYEAIQTGLKAIAQKAVELEASIHMPRIGCGLAGGKWHLIEPLINENLIEFGIPVTVYDFEEPPKRKRPNSGGGGGGGGRHNMNRPPKSAKSSDPTSSTATRRNPAFKAFYRD